VEDWSWGSPCDSDDNWLIGSLLGGVFYRFNPTLLWASLGLSMLINAVSEQLILGISVMCERRRETSYNAQNSITPFQVVCTVVRLLPVNMLEHLTPI
jgi:hypothetical protein